MCQESYYRLWLATRGTTTGCGPTSKGGRGCKCKLGSFAVRPVRGPLEQTGDCVVRPPRDHHADELHDFLRVFDTWLALDPAGDVHPVGTTLFDGLGDVLRFQP